MKIALKAPVGRHPGFVLVSYAFAVTMMGTTLPTPLYPIYQQGIGFSSLLVTVIFATYAVGVIAALLLFGQLSDEIGRRWVLLAGLLLSAASALAFLFAGDLTLLFVGRMLSGLSAGIFTGTATAALVDLAPQEEQRKATLIAAGVNMGGLGLGPLLSGVLAQYAVQPLRLVFIINLILLVLAIAGILMIPEPVEVKTNVRLRLQRLRVPAQVRATFIHAAIPGFVGFAVLGLFTAVAPEFLNQTLHIPNHALTGLVVFAVFASSTVGQLLLERFPQRLTLPAGCIGLIIGLVLVASGLQAHSLALLVTGAVVAGLGQGLSFRAGLAEINARSPSTQRGEIASSFFVVLYVAISIPIIGVGMAAQIFGLQVAGIAFSAIMAILALIALIILVTRPDAQS
ncbi:putative multi-drug efflux transporter [Dictyobacter formicarum]|uniref:Multi-drug efflux transporter n=2 Tax=Dictyobacter formicarum TaxID=2778368 RepID=A0ABQ3VF32_9CHLR|nr:putative multi-drug efflux transporter [Dictyobacter formicarum]